MIQKRDFKSVRTSSNGPRSFRKWAEWGAGDTVVLKFISTLENKFDKSKTQEKPNYLFKIMEVVELQDKKFKFATENLVLNTTGKLKYLMESLLVQPNEVVLFKYLGISILSSGDFEGKEVHDIDMEVIDWEGSDSSSPSSPDMDL